MRSDSSPRAVTSRSGRGRTRTELAHDIEPVTSAAESSTTRSGRVPTRARERPRAPSPTTVTEKPGDAPGSRAAVSRDLHLVLDDQDPLHGTSLSRRAGRRQPPARPTQVSAHPLVGASAEAATTPCSRWCHSRARASNRLPALLVPRPGAMPVGSYPTDPTPRKIPPIRKNPPNRSNGKRKNPGKKHPVLVVHHVHDLHRPARSPGPPAPARCPGRRRCVRPPGTRPRRRRPPRITTSTATITTPRRIFDLLRLASASTMAPGYERLVKSPGRFVGDRLPRCVRLVDPDLPPEPSRVRSGLVSRIPGEGDTLDWSDEDPGLPIKLGPCSNAEYDPEPVLPLVLRETVSARHRGVRAQRPTPGDDAAGSSCCRSAAQRPRSSRLDACTPRGVPAIPFRDHERARRRAT